MRGFLGKALPIILIGAIAGGYFWYVQKQNPCVSPIEYHIGSFDQRFGVSRADFLSALNEAAGIWNKAAGKTLLAYNANGSLPINLIYDTREATTQQNQGLVTTIDQGKQVADSVRQEYTSLRTTYEADAAAYQSALDAYNQKLDAYNKEVDYWNSQGGAPRSEYQKLASEKDALSSERNDLEQQRLSINAKASQINALIDKYNLLVTHVNANVSVVNQTAGREFNEGEYIRDASGTRINIYEFQNHDKLVRVLAHELGHALGLGHNGNPNSIMYYLNEGTNVNPSPDDIAGLQALCKTN